MEQSNIYIIKKKGTSYPSIQKIVIKEITRTTYLVENLDRNNTTYRTLIDKFNENWKVIEEVTDCNSYKGIDI